MAKTITIGWNGSKLTVSPDPCYAGAPSGSAVEIDWVPQSPVSAIKGVVIKQKDQQPYSGTQPSGTSSQYTWSDPESATDTYTYCVSATVTGVVGTQSLDPRVINTSG